MKTGDEAFGFIAATCHLQMAAYPVRITLERGGRARHGGAQRAVLRSLVKRKAAEMRARRGYFLSTP